MQRADASSTFDLLFALAERQKLDQISATRILEAISSLTASDDVALASYGAEYLRVFHREFLARAKFKSSLILRKELVPKMRILVKKRLEEELEDKGNETTVASLRALASWLEHGDE